MSAHVWYVLHWARARRQSLSLVSTAKIAPTGCKAAGRT